MSLLHEIEQAAGSGHQDFGPAPDAIHLRLLPDPAEHHHVAQGKIAAVGGETFADLGGQLARGREHQGAWSAQAFAPGRASQAIQDGDGEGRGLAGAGLRAAEQIAAGKQKRNGLRLDRRGHAVALGVKRAANGIDDVELCKGADGIHFSLGCPRETPSEPALTRNDPRRPLRGWLVATSSSDAGKSP
jgi:hypothetical protein